MTQGKGFFLGFLALSSALLVIAGKANEAAALVAVMMGTLVFYPDPKVSPAKPRSAKTSPLV